MEAKIKWIDQVKFKGESETGHNLLMDGPSESGGENQGMRPMELILLGIGGCTSYDVVTCLLYTSPSPRDATLSRMPSSA